MKMQAESTRQSNTGSVAAAIKRILRISDRTVEALMPGGENDRQHYIGGYLVRSDKSEVQEEYERDTEGWTIVD
jgi:hypothetical protein